MSAVAAQLAAEMAAARACTVCAGLPLGPRPILRGSVTARLLIIGQAPGTRVHETGIPWNDPSGDRLRLWLGMAPEDFYDEAKVAILPTGLCYPGRMKNGGDAPPRRECAPLWHPRLRPLFRDVRLTLLVGSYAQVQEWGKGEMTARVQRFAAHLPGLLPLPHPSWRTVGWEKRNPWFAAEVLPALRAAVAAVLA